MPTKTAKKPKGRNQKESIYNAVVTLLDHLTVDELVDLSDNITIEIFDRTDDGTRYDLDDVMKEIEGEKQEK